VSEKFNMMTYRIDSLNLHDLPFIIHYAGAHKPWQLSPRFRSECIRHQCPWAQWYASEAVLQNRSESASLLSPSSAEHNLPWEQGSPEQIASTPGFEW